MTIRKYLLLLEKHYGKGEDLLTDIEVIHIEINGKNKKVEFNPYWWKESNYIYLDYEFELVFPMVDYGSKLYLTFVLKENFDDKTKS